MTAPELSITPVAIERAGESSWRIRWEIANLSRGPVELVEVWLPHSGFNAARHVLEPSRTLLPRETVIFETGVRCSAQPGEIVENAFVILRVGSDGREWRVFARLRVTGVSP